MLLAALLIVAAQNAEPDAAPLRAGQPAPYAGILMPAEMAIRLGQRVESCEFELQQSVVKSDRLLSIEKTSCEQRIKLLETTTKLHVNDLEQQLLAAHKAAERQWWENPALSIGIGIGAGILFTAGAVYLAGQLSPAAVVVSQ